MKLLTSPKAIYLLEADLAVLHEESREWLNDVKFWRDEIAFFYTLMVKKSGIDPSSESKDEVVRIQDELLHLSGKEFNDLENAINTHENYLAAILENNSLSNEQDFREKHKVISLQIRLFEYRLKALKNDIFHLVKRA